jgi:ribonucleoside-diphosphate reductase alpha chain
VDLDQPAPAHKPPHDARDRLPNRRSAITTSFQRDGAKFEMTTGHYPDGRVGEIFLAADRANSLLDFLMSDAAILASIALQYGAPLDEIRHALKRDIRGAAASPIGTALDLIQ